MAKADRKNKARQKSAVCIKEKSGTAADTVPRKVTLTGRRSEHGEDKPPCAAQTPPPAEQTAHTKPHSEEAVTAAVVAVPVISTDTQAIPMPAPALNKHSEPVKAAHSEVVVKTEPDAEARSATAPEKPAPWYIPQSWKDITLLRKIIMIASATLFVFSFFPIALGILSPGIIPPACIALFFFGCALYWPRISGCESKAGKTVITAVAACVLIGVCYLAFVSGKMISASVNTLPDNSGQVTVVVLGCKVKGDRPSLMLKARLDTAAEFLLEHPQAYCIVTGGQGPDEEYPEALVMKNYLAARGVSSARIIMEDQSTSTLENITNAKALADRYNCYDRYLIVTDRFHQYRAMCTANDLGMVSYALNVETVWYLVMQYWFREIAAITRDWIVAA